MYLSVLIRIRNKLNHRIEKSFLFQVINVFIQNIQNIINHHQVP
jgi:hypothetical protein